MINIYPKHEKNNLYKCHFCQQNIDVYGIGKHFAMFHKFRHSFESQYICEFCDDVVEFHLQTNLFQHIQNTHNLTNDTGSEVAISSHWKKENPDFCN